MANSQRFIQISLKLAGIYLHIPFCKQACHYCDFHFSTSLSNKKEFVSAIIKEIKLQENYLNQEVIDTIYFGGGTPSLLTENELGLILNELAQIHTIASDAELTLEANPDDLNPKNLKTFKSLGLNRLSIGIQTFHDPFLKWMNRAHNAHEALKCVSMAKEAGFDNLSIDLIYGIPHIDHSVWESDLAQAMALNVNHISAYNLTIENKTVFGKWKKTGKLSEATDEFAAQQFEMLINTLAANKYTQYEISNFCKNENYSKHNSSYWKGIKYVGLGPSAHSYNGHSRQSNVSHNSKYINSLHENIMPSTVEILSEKDKANEHLITRLRTMWGADTTYLYQFKSLDFSAFESTLKNYVLYNYITKTGTTLTLTEKGKFLADKIIRDLFFE